MTEILIRDYEAADWEIVSQIHDAARPIELAGSCDPRAFVPLANDVSDLKEFLASKKLVACRGSQVVGFVCVDADAIGWLYVDPRQAGQGIGRFLVREALAVIGKPASVFVLSGNSIAMSLYISEGFKQVDRFKSRHNGYPCTVLKLAQ